MQDSSDGGTAAEQGPVRIDPVTIAAGDGARLAATLYRPAGDGPFATLVEALPYRMHDITSSYADSYLRFAAEGGFAVLRLDLRGTGSSGGTLPDEYADLERDDLRTVIGWITSQPWSTGRVGMFGTSYSGFNSLHMAADGVPGLDAVVAMYATDDRYTDDVHYCGGVLRALDLIDYPLYMVAMNALPPVPSVWGDGWEAEWHRRITDSPPWMLGWLQHPEADATWRRGSIRLGPDGEGYERISCPTMLIAGWADGYRNNTFRTVAELGVPWRLLAGPWVHKDPSTARPGPNVDSDREIMAFFDEHLRGGPPSSAHPAQVFVRRPTPPEPDLAHHAGTWHEFDRWPDPSSETLVLTVDGPPGVDELDVRGDTGMYAWNSCAGGLPWGQPLDQRLDNARSITHDWPRDPADGNAAIVGHARVSLRVRSSATVGHVSVKLCDVAPDGTSTLITRGMLDLGHRGCWPADAFGRPDGEPEPLVPGRWYDVDIELEATTWTLVPGHRLRLAIAGTDWPNCWPPAHPFVLGVARESVRLQLPIASLAPCTHPFVAGPGPSDGDDDGVVWRYEHDVLARETRVHSRYGGRYDGEAGIVIDDLYEGSLGISTVDLARGWARGRSRFDLHLPLDDGSTAVCSTESRLDVRSDEHAFHVVIELDAWRDGELVAERRWTDTLPR
ncbi:MAG: CocE/NonD family hydrolase [Actinobacteria bacterium]|uniref:Unannotated protein n=1 Tax=freshwater metagenome TaxID=449393 RepID=A0A6J6DC54_9ZZZZ|nr:CocE/NonD family hydrolase [Actinomycetota bacterium]